MAAVTVLAAASLLCACSLVHHYFGGGDETAGPAPIITLRVDNQNYYDATVYALSEAGERQRLGQVTGLSRGTFRFRWIHDQLRVIIRLLADGSAVTEPVIVSPGDSLHLVIQPDLHLRISD